MPQQPGGEATRRCWRTEVTVWMRAAGFNSTMDDRMLRRVVGEVLRAGGFRREGQKWGGCRLCRHAAFSLRSSVIARKPDIAAVPKSIKHASPKSPNSQKTQYPIVMMTTEANSAMPTALAITCTGGQSESTRGFAKKYVVIALARLARPKTSKSICGSTGAASMNLFMRAGRLNRMQASPKAIPNAICRRWSFESRRSSMSAILAWGGSMIRSTPRSPDRHQFGPSKFIGGGQRSDEHRGRRSGGTGCLVNDTNGRNALDGGLRSVV